MRLGVIADVLTGANDTGVQFARRGARTLVPLDWHDLRSLARRADVLVLNTNSRAVAPRVAAQRARVAAEALRRAGVEAVYKKIDSTFRGNIGQEPRLGFNWNPRSGGGGFLGFLTGGDKLVVRGGYARTHDYAFLNIALNVFSSFPQLATVTPRAPVANAWTLLPTLEPVGLNPDLLTRTIVAEDFRSPYVDQFSLEAQRQMTDNLVLRVGYVGTRGHDLYQTLHGNPNQPFTRVRVNPSRGVIRLRDNTARSWYNSRR